MRLYILINIIFKSDLRVKQKNKNKNKVCKYAILGSMDILLGNPIWGDLMWNFNSGSILDFDQERINEQVKQVQAE